MILYIDACVREESRTRKLAEALLDKLQGEIKILRLYDGEVKALDGPGLDKRTADGEAGDFSGSEYDFAKAFAAADTVVIAAPYWDLSFPAKLKEYIESICITGITFRYSEKGIPIGMCRAEKLYYVTTAGGPIIDEAFGYGYIAALAKGMFGIGETKLIKAENLDIWGNNPEQIVEDAIEAIEL